MKIQIPTRATNSAQRLVRRLFTPLAVFAVWAISSQSASAVLLDFTGTSSTVYADNFSQASSGTFFSQQSGYVRGSQGTNFKGASVYAPATSSFSAETVKLNAAITGPLGTSPSLFVFSRIDDLNVGFSAQVFLVSSTNVRIVLSYNTNVTNPPGGTTLLDWEYNVFSGGAGFYRSAQNNAGGSGATGNTLLAGTEYQLVLESTADNQFKFSFNTAAGNLIATTGFQTSAGLNASVASSGDVGFGGLASNAAGNTLQFYSFSAVPEPGSVSLLLGGVAFFLLRTLRRQRQCQKN